MSEAVFDVRERLRWMLDENTCNISTLAAEGARGALEILDCWEIKNISLQEECKRIYNQMMDTEKDFQKVLAEKEREITCLKEALETETIYSEYWKAQAMRTFGVVQELKQRNEKLKISWKAERGI